MTSVLFTVDTELSLGLHQRGFAPLDNLRVAVLGEVGDGAWGIGYQIARLNAHGLKGVFFVEALCAHVFGPDVLKRVVEPVLTGGHEVQLHLHTEWLRWIDKDPVGGRRGTNIADFAYDDQRVLLSLGLEAMVRAGAPMPTAFRAGNYGASNDTLRALAGLGVTYDSSYNEPYLGTSCAIEWDVPLYRPLALDGIVEIPITFFEDYPGHTRPLQLCAASGSEIRWVVEQSLAQARPTVVVVSHSFELLNQRRTRANAMLLRRFDGLCALLQSLGTATRSASFSDLGALRPGTETSAASPLRSSAGRTVARMIEQSIGSVLYDRA